MHAVETLPATSWDAFRTALDRERIPFLEAVAQRAMDFVAMRPNADVVQLEADSGSVAWLAARRARRVLCVEDWPPSLQGLERRVRAEPLANVSILRAPTRRLPCERSVFDVAFWVLPIGLRARELATDLTEVARVIKPGGHLVAMLWTGLRRKEAAQEADWNEHVDAWTRAWPGTSCVREYRYDLVAPSKASLRYATHATDGLPGMSKPGRALRFAMARQELELAERAAEPIDVTGATFVIAAAKSGRAVN